MTTEHGSRGIYEAGMVLRTVVGSGVHGIAIEGTDDHDEMAVYIEPVDMVVGVSAWDYPNNRVGHTERTGMPHYVWRTQPEGARSGPGDTDLVAYSLRNYVRLAGKGNPTALLPLWAPPEAVLYADETGLRLRALRQVFMSRHAVRRFLGYMDAQRERMLGEGKQNRVPNRPELVEKYGYDVKYASHALRLAYQGHEIATTGRLTLPLPEDTRLLVRDVKTGQVPRETVASWIDKITEETRAALDTPGGCPLPDNPDWERINRFVVRAHRNHWERT